MFLAMSINNFRCCFEYRILADDPHTLLTKNRTRLSYKENVEKCARRDCRERESGESKMLKLLPPEADQFHNFKCGEIYCITSSTYRVACCICELKVLFEQFPHHFQQHLSQTEERIVVQPIEDVKDPIKTEEDEIEDDQSQLNNQLLLDKDKVEEDNEQRVEKEVTVPTLRRSKRGERLTETPIINDEKEIELIQSEELKVSCGGDEPLKSNENPKEINNDKIDEDFNEDDSDWRNEHFSFSSGPEMEDEYKVSKRKRPVKLHSCEHCTRTYKSKSSLNYHLIHNHNITLKTTFKCDDCGEEFKTEENLRRHRWKHTGVICDICGKPFSEGSGIKRHRLRHTGIKAFKCEECGKDFYTLKEQNAHMLIHTGIMPHICEICGRPCRDRGVLKAHMRRHTGERPAKCDVCGKSFYSIHDLNVHAVAHTNERPFICEICGSSFQRKKALRVHKKIHSTERNHKCKVCGKAFIQASGVTAHMRSHDTAASTVGSSRSTDLLLGITMTNTNGTGIK